ncbi:PTS fructose transporter subunit IIABC [Mycoplasmopsis fermentans]|uniref:PTS fructose transporter subunit IIABC n=1 Tax=Mycoplasmopsis fermentans TaxID=2115 RepID=UPI000F029C84|nr:fructose-specific PTS transporter subunit EIIC [Mycoplasmopsis fermentans]RMX35148.1 PTS system, fructose subfamily, IIA component domain protein [Mycoplasmopsis fermentans MF-I1]RMX35203.1 PTS system, fructose subfamily, IIA component domain protein [Mycoplasmopsis fermentans MF-I2]
MKIKELLTLKNIDINAKAKDKLEAIELAVNLMGDNIIIDKNAYLTAVLEREKQTTTGLGDELALPHGRGSFVKKPHLSALVLKDGVDYQSLDNKPVKLLFLIAAPETTDSENLHLEVLAKLSKMLVDKVFIEKLINAKSNKEFLKLIETKEQEVDQNEFEQTNNGEKFIVAVTACPTGIAHTYMAQESLENAAKEMGYQIKVETQGSGGAKNVLTNEDIQKAYGVIVAADTNIEITRFNGKRLLQTTVTKGIKQPKELIQEIIDEKVAVYKSDSSSNENTNQEKLSFGKQIYKNLMNGVSHMLPFVIGGGILIALAFLFDSFLGKEAVGKDFGQYTPFSKFFKNAGGFAFGFMMSVFAGFIAHSIAGRPGLAVGMVAGAMASSTQFAVYETGSNAGFLGALIGGFIAGFLVLGLKWCFKWLPKSLDGLKPMLIYPVFGILLIAVIMFFVINTPLSYLNYYIQQGLNYVVKNNTISIGFKIGMGALLAGMMAADMGGPVNKVAYTIGVASVDPDGINQPWIMAAVMIGGMVPPLVIAIAADLFPQKFTAKERKDSKVNYLMGMAFITEGAIPYAASDPLRVIGSSIFASALAGGMAAGLGCSIPAPHGGIFVFVVAQGWYWYLLALAVGAFAGAFILGALRKKVDPSELGRWKGIPIGNGVYLKRKAKQTQKVEK